MKFIKMKVYRYNDEKREKLIRERGIDFEEIIQMLENWDYIDIRWVPSRENQKMFILYYDDDICCVPFVENEEEVFLKTAYYSRKMRHFYLKS